MRYSRVVHGMGVYIDRMLVGLLLVAAACVEDASSTVDAGDDLACSNDTLDSNESDVDCGGQCGASCSDGSLCLSNDDCISGYCRPALTCAQPLVPVALWQFEEGMGDTASDSSGKGNDASLISMAESSWAEGKVGQGLVFDGVDDLVDGGSNPELMLTDFMSVELWVRFDAFTTYEYLIENGVYRVFHRGSFTRNVVYFVFNITEPEFLGDSQWTPAVAVATATELVLGQWHHLVGTKDANTISIYLDGKKEKEIYCESCFTIDASGASSFRIGRGFQGAIDEVGVFSRAMTADEVFARYEEGS